jgi:hypothetical protein
MPRKPCIARIEASEARTFGLRSSAKVTAFLKAVKKGRPAFFDSLKGAPKAQGSGCSLSDGVVCVVGIKKDVDNQ